MALPEKLTAEQKQLREVENSLEKVRRKIRDLRSEERALEDERKEIEKLIKSKTIRQDGAQFKGARFTWSDEIKRKLSQTFAMQAFRGSQEAAINCVLSGKDCIVIMPTGAGKSLTYQLSSFHLRGLTVVITPLVSLMEDQVMQVTARYPALPVACLHSQLAREQASSILKRMLFPSPSEDTLLLYVTPERVAKSKLFMTKLQKCWELKKLRLLAIDEVHCCSQWGHDFRPDYNYLGILKKQFPAVPILGLTATASQTIVSDVISMLGLDEDLVVLRDSFDRPNLKYTVKSATGDVTAVVAKLILEHYRDQSGIIYCFSIREAEEVARRLVSDFGISAHSYHASLESERRSRIHQKWSCGKLQVVVATVAFGMGIDKADVRFVLHFSIPKSLENYYQESGRAGRDGQPANCIIYFKFQDIFRQSSMVFTEKAGTKNLYDVVSYCLDTTSCRRQLLAKHFSEGSVPDSSIGTIQCDRNEQACDNCRREKVTRSVDVTTYVELMSSAIDDAQAAEVRLTGNKLVEALRKKVKSLAKERIEHLVAWCLCQGYLEEKYHFTPYSTIPFLAPGSGLADVVAGRQLVKMQTTAAFDSSVKNSAQQKRKRSQLTDD